MKSLAFLLLALGIVGCYSQRWTSNFVQFPDIADETATDVVGGDGLSDGEKASRIAELKKIAEEPEETYRINAGDRLQITVYDHADLNMSTLVTPDGHIGIVFLGEVKVAGLTLAEASRKIEDGLAEFIKKPAVGITATDIASQTASIVGAVAGPGLFPIYNGMRISDIYAKAGGSSVRDIDGQWLDVADFVHSVFIRNGKILPVDFTNAITRGDPVDNLVLRKGDYIFIASRTEAMVCLIGSVARPHKRIWDPSLGLLEVLTTGGWMKETYWPNVILIRGGYANPKMYKINVDSIVTGRAANVQMQAGDVVFVPHDNASEYNVFVRKLLPSTQLVGTFLWPVTFFSNR